MSYHKQDVLPSSSYPSCITEWLQFLGQGLPLTLCVYSTQNNAVPLMDFQI